MRTVIFLLLLPYPSSAKDCDNTIIDLNKSNFTVKEITFTLNQICEWKFMVSNDSFIEINLTISNFYGCSYEIEDSMGRTFTGLSKADLHENREYPPPVVYLRAHCTKENVDENTENKMARFKELAVSRVKLQFASATKLDLARDSPIFYPIEEPAGFLLISANKSVHFQCMCSSKNRLGDVYIFEGNASSQSLIGTSDTLRANTSNLHIIFDHDIFLIWMRPTTACVMMFMDHQEYEKYYGYQFLPSSGGPFSLKGENTPFALTVSPTNTEREKFAPRAFFVNDFVMTKGTALDVFQGIPREDGYNLLYTLRDDTTAIFPHIFNELIYTFVLYNGAANLEFKEAYDDITTYLGTKPHSFNVSVEGEQASFTIQHDDDRVIVADTAYILSFLNGTHIAKGKDGQPLISFFPVKDVQKYRNCKVTFTSIVRAGMYLNQWNNKCPPQSTNKLVIRYWVERPNNGNVSLAAKHDKKPKPNNIRPAPLPTRPSNCIIIHGLPENITVAHICAFVGGNVARGNSNQPLIRILPVKNGYRSARVILISIAEARQLINNKHGKPLLGYSHNLTINYQVDRGNGRKYDADTTKKVRQAAVAGTKSVLIKGLLENCNEQYLISLIGQEKIATSHKGRLLVTMFPGYTSAKVTFKSVSDAQKFISNYHGTPLVANRKLTVQFYLEREEQKPLSKPIVTGERHTDKAKTIVRNVAYIQGINRKKLVLEGMTGGKIVKTKIYRYENGTSQGRGLVIYRDAEEAEICVDNLNGVKLDHNDVALKVGLFESTKFRRLREAIGNAHLFTPNSKGFAYGCVGCFEYWDERDMLGCVPLDRQEDPESHFMCQACVRKYSEGKKAGGRLGNFGTGLPCGQDDCRRILLWASVNRVLTNADTATRLDKRMTHEALRDFEEIEYCKEENCDFGAILPDPLLQQFFACQNPSCMAQFCRICKVSFEHHIERSCDQVNPRRQLGLDRLRLTDIYGF